MMKSAINLRSPKRSDLMVEKIKRWVADQKLAPGDKPPVPRTSASSFAKVCRWG